MIKELATQLDQTAVEIEQIEAQIAEVVTDLQTKLRTAQEQDAQLRGQLKAAMAEQGIKKYTSERFDIVYIAPSTRVIVDSKRMKEENPELWEKYSKESKVTDSVRITIKQEELKGEVH